MFCKNCGAQLDDNMSFCTSCGTPVVKSDESEKTTVLQENSVRAEDQNAAYNYNEYTEQSYNNYYNQYQTSVPVVDEAAKSKAATPILVLGILGLVSNILLFCCCSGYPGLIMSIIALVKSNKYKNEYGEITGKAKAGRILAIICIVLSIINIIINIVLTIIQIATNGMATLLGGMAASSSSYTNDYYYYAMNIM